MAIVDSTAPLAALPDGPLVTITLNKPDAAIAFVKVISPSLGSVTVSSAPVTAWRETAPGFPIYLPLITGD